MSENSYMDDFVNHSSHLMDRGAGKGNGEPGRYRTAITRRTE
jgi:hypothetical protein